MSSTEASSTSPGTSPSLSGAAAPATHEHTPSQDRPLEVRFLIEHTLVGGVIGTSGSNVKHVRHETGTFVTILPGSQPHQTDRIMQLRGEVEHLAKAISMIAELVIEAQMHLKAKNAEATGAPKSDRRPEKVAFRMLVHMTTAGAIIGKGAVLLKETQDTADVRISVSPMPLPGSTEKTVTVSGTPAALQIAFARMFQQLKDCPPPRTRPTLYNPSAQPAMPQYYQTAAPMYPQMHPYPAAAAPGPTSTQKIAVPSVCAGCIIGRGGTVIRDLRARSGAQISIQDADPKAPTERVVTLTGTPQAIQNAVFMIRQLVEQYQPRPAGGEKY